MPPLDPHQPWNEGQRRTELWLEAAAAGLAGMAAVAIGYHSWRVRGSSTLLAIGVIVLAVTAPLTWSAIRWPALPQKRQREAIRIGRVIGITLVIGVSLAFGDLPIPEPSHGNRRTSSAAARRERRLGIGLAIVLGLITWLIALSAVGAFTSARTPVVGWVAASAAALACGGAVILLSRWSASAIARRTEDRNAPAPPMRGALEDHSRRAARGLGAVAAISSVAVGVGLTVWAEDSVESVPLTLAVLVASAVATPLITVLTFRAALWTGRLIDRTQADQLTSSSRTGRHVEDLIAYCRRSRLTASITLRQRGETCRLVLERGVLVRAEGPRGGGDSAVSTALSWDPDSTESELSLLRENADVSGPVIGDVEMLIAQGVGMRPGSS